MKRAVLVVVAAAVVLAGIGVAVGLSTSGPAPMVITARFATAPGLYVGNQVRILGMEVGEVTRITPGPSYVTVQMQLPAGTPVPATANAYVIAAEVVNDRYVQLDPAYSGGPRLADHAVIPLARTAVPVSVDGIIDSLDQLSKALGPNGVNAHGALSAFFRHTAEAFGSNGSALHGTLVSLGGALGALSEKGPDLTALFDNLGKLSKVASGYTTTYQTFANDLAVVSTDLAADDGDIGAALGNLQRALGALAQFIRDNGASLGASVTNLDTFAGAVATKQAQLAEALGDLPIALDNITAAYDPGAPGGPGLRSRLDLMGNSAGFDKAVCGNALLRLLLLSVDQSQDRQPGLDLACGVSGLLATLPTPPGASSGPDLSLAALVRGAP